MAEIAYPVDACPVDNFSHKDDSKDILKVRQFEEEDDDDEEEVPEISYDDNDDVAMSKFVVDF